MWGPEEARKKLGKGTSSEGNPVSPDKENLLRRLKRIEGQVRGLQRMIDEERDCAEVLIQLAALREALSRVGTALLIGHVERCFRDGRGPEGTPEERSERLKEVVELFLKYS